MATIHDISTSLRDFLVKKSCQNITYPTDSSRHIGVSSRTIDEDPYLVIYPKGKELFWGHTVRVI